MRKLCVQHNNPISNQRHLYQDCDNSLSKILPPLRATCLGASGERPFAISSALRKRTSVARFLRNSVAKVVFPAPLQPAINGGFGGGHGNQFKSSFWQDA